MASEKNYTISTPYYSVKDAPAGALQTKSLEDMQAERYFTDVYHIFLSQLTQIAQKSEVSDVDYKKLARYFEQVVALKKDLDVRTRRAVTDIAKKALADSHGAY